MKISIVISTLFALLVGSVNAQSESDSLVSSTSPGPTGTSESSGFTASMPSDLSPTTTPTPTPNPNPNPSPTSTSTSTTFVLPPAPDVSSPPMPLTPLLTSSSGGAVPTALAGMQQIVLGVAAGVAGAAVF